MNCFKCGKNTINFFCEECIPRYGDVVESHSKEEMLFVGSIPILKVLKYCRTHRIIKWWMGTDVLTLNIFPPGKSVFKVLLHRLKMTLLEPFISKHLFVSERLMNRSRTKKEQEVVVHQAKHIEKDKKPFVVGYYLPEETEFNNWIYGKDIIERLVYLFEKENILFLKYDGKYDIKVFLSEIDVYIRPSRSDGMPRLILLCEQNNIPYCWNNDLNELIYFIRLKKKGI